MQQSFDEMIVRLRVSTRTLPVLAHGTTGRIQAGAVLGNQLTNRLAGNTLDQATAHRLIEAGEEITPSMLAGLSPEATQVVKTALANSFSVVFLAVMLVMVAGFVVALTLPNADLDEETPVENQTEGKVTHSLN